MSTPYQPTPYRRIAILLMGVLPVLIQTAPSSAQCTPVELQKLTASDAAANDFLGYYVAIDGDTAVITALGDDNAGGIDAGAAFVDALDLR